MSLEESFNHNLIIDKVKKTIESNRLLEYGDSVLVGVSGGPDSMCLLDILRKLSRQKYYSIEVAHVNHSLRKDESDCDQKFVAAYCKDNDLVFHTCTLDVAGFSREHSMGIEEAARFLRYQYFQECTGNRKMRIAVAHHLQDQAETILLNLIRGCGLDGLKGMEYLAGNLVRPLLDCAKEEIEEYLAYYKIPFCIDKSNLEPCVDRNRIRLELLPYFQQLFGRDVSASILKTRNLCFQDASCLDKISKQEFQSLCHEGSIPCDVLAAADPAIRSRVVRSLYEAAKGNKKNLSLPQTDSILQIVAKNKDGSSVSLSDGFCAVVFQNELRIMKKEEFSEIIKQEKREKEKARSVQIPLIIPAKRYEEEINRIICTKLIENPQEVDYNAMARSFPYSMVKSCVWRYRREGDWIRPNRGSGKKTLKKYFIDEKIPCSQRDHFLLLAKGSEILWIPDLQTNRTMKPSFSGQEAVLPSNQGLAEYVYIRLEHRS